MESPVQESIREHRASSKKHTGIKTGNEEEFAELSPECIRKWVPHVYPLAPAGYLTLVEDIWTNDFQKSCSNIRTNRKSDL